MTELLVHVLCYFVIRERSLFLSCGGLGLLLSLLLLIFQEFYGKYYKNLWFGFLRKNTKYLFPPYIFIINIWFFSFSYFKNEHGDLPFLLHFLFMQTDQSFIKQKKIETSMDCNLEALATLMLFHIKVSLFYPFDSQRLDFVKIIVSDLVEI